MESIRKNFAKLFVLSLFPLAITACNNQPAVSYSQDVKPVLDKYCLECHQVGGAGTLASGFDLSSFEGLMKGTNFGPMVIAGDSEGSNLLVLIEGRADPACRTDGNQYPKKILKRSVHGSNKVQKTTRIGVIVSA